jgi:hypothetical protein
MKPLRTLATFLSLVACTCGTSAQTTLTTYYVIPPTNGCDGTWAFGPYSALWNACTGPYTWIFDPIDCVDGSQWGQPIPLNVVGDTIIMDLCSQPCDFLFYADTGLCMVCFCGPLIPTDLPGIAGEGSFSIGPNPVPSNSPVLVLNPGNNGPQHAQVLDLAGRSLLVRTLNGGRSELDLKGIPPGGYLILLRDDAGHISSQRFQIQ